MKLVNVRLSDEDAAKVADLRRSGVELSEVVREAVRARHLALRAPLEPEDVRPMLAALYAKYPIDETDERVEVDVTNRKAVSELVRRKLRAK